MHTYLCNIYIIKNQEFNIVLSKYLLNRKFFILFLIVNNIIVLQLSLDSPDLNGHKNLSRIDHL